MSISDAKGWPIGMDLCCKWVAVPSGTGCNWVAVPLCWVQSRLWHRCNEGCIGMHMGHMCLRAHSTVVHTWCTRTLCSNLVRMATVTWADTPWTNPWGVLYPSRVTTPFLSYSFMNLWIGEMACLVQLSHVLYSDFCADVLAWAGYREMWW